MLLKAGAGVNHAKNDGATSLFAAAQDGHSDVVFKLLAAGAKVNLAMHDGATPVYIAAMGGHAKALKALVKAGANLDTPKTNGATPVYIAAQNGNSDCLQTLLKSGANAGAAVFNGRPALHACTVHGHVECVEILTVTLPNKQAWRSFLIGSGSRRELQYMLLPNTIGVTKNFLPLLYKREFLEEIYKFLKKPRYVDADRKDRQGRTALMIAQAEGRVEVEEMLESLGNEVPVVST